MRRPLVVSLILHALILVLALVAVRLDTHPPESVETPVAVDIVPVMPESNPPLAAKATPEADAAAVPAKPEPRPEPAPAKAEPEPPAAASVAKPEPVRKPILPKPDIVARAEPAAKPEPVIKPEPPVRPDPAPKAESKPAPSSKPTTPKPQPPEKPEAEPEPVAAPPSKPRTQPKETAEAEVAAKTPPKKEAPPPPSGRPEVKPEAKPDAKPEAKPDAKPDGESDFASVMKTVDDLKRQGAAPEAKTDGKTNGKFEARPESKNAAADGSFADQISRAIKSSAPPSSKSGNPALPVSMSEIDAVRRQIERCWNLPTGAKEADNLIVAIRVEMNLDGTPRRAAVDEQAGMTGNPFYRAAAESALRAVLNPRCHPFKLPPEKYERWRTMTLVFNPKEMFGT
jgi:hypothetical protein